MVIRIDDNEFGYKNFEYEIYVNDEKRVEKPSDLVKVGDEILVKVIELGKEDGKFSLSAKDAMKV